MTGGAGSPGGVVELRNTTISNIADFGLRIEKGDAAAATIHLVDTVRACESTHGEPYAHLYVQSQILI